MPRLGLVNGLSGIGFFQNRCNLGLSEFRLAHGNLLARVAIVPKSTSCRTAYFSGELTHNSWFENYFAFSYAAVLTGSIILPFE